MRELRLQNEGQGPVAVSRHILNRRRLSWHRGPTPVAGPVSRSLVMLKTFHSTPDGLLMLGTFPKLPDAVILRPVPENYLTPLAEMRPVPGAGFGSFAVAPIVAGTIVATFGGTLMNRATFDRQDPERRTRSIQIEEDAFLLGPPEREPGDAINHSCEPNCGMGGAAQVVAMRDIATGEPLTFDYAMTDGSNYDEFSCACGSPTCRQAITGNDWSLEVLQRRYAGYFSPYLVRRMTAAALAQPLKKADVEALMNHIDHDPVAALTNALRLALGRPHSTFEVLVELAPIEPAWRHGVIEGHAAALDRLAMHLNERRSV